MWEGFQCIVGGLHQNPGSAHRRRSSETRYTRPTRFQAATPSKSGRRRNSFLPYRRLERVCFTTCHDYGATYERPHEKRYGYFKSHTISRHASRRGLPPRAHALACRAPLLSEETWGMRRWGVHFQQGNALMLTASHSPAARMVSGAALKAAERDEKTHGPPPHRRHARAGVLLWHVSAKRRRTVTAGMRAVMCGNQRRAPNRVSLG